MKKFFTFLFALLPSILSNIFLRLLGHNVSLKSKIGFSFLWIDEITLEEGSVIGHFNFIKIESLLIKGNGGIRNLNFFKGPFKVVLLNNTNIGKTNRFQRAKYPVTYYQSSFILGNGSRVTSGNYFDLTNNITFGANCQVAGIGTQFWTHGYMHADKGVERIRIDGEIKIGNNVYIGSRCLFNPGVTVKDAINIGGNSVISKDLIEPGMYVNQSLRYLETDINKTRNKLRKVAVKGLIEEVYTKNKD